MINPFKDVNWQPDRSGLRAFARSLVIGFPIVAVVLLCLTRLATGVWAPTTPLVVGTVGAGLGLLFLLIPPLARPFYVVWYALACAIGLVVSNALMMLVFYGIFTPVGLAMRLAGRRPLATTRDRTLPTYWLTVKPSTDHARYLRQF